MTEPEKPPRQPRTKTGRGANVSIYFKHAEAKYLGWTREHPETAKTLIKNFVDLVETEEEGKL